MNTLIVSLSKKCLWPVLVFVIALAVRLVYNLVFFDHRICDIGDSSYYLLAGKKLAELVQSTILAGNGDFISRLCTATSIRPGSFDSFSSSELTDRLLLDGPIFPSYLAVLFLLLGKTAGGAVNAFSTFFACANSVVDALTCVVVYYLGKSFSNKVGLVAALGFAFYAPAVINTQQCYAEPFTYFLLSLWCLTLANLRLNTAGQEKADGQSSLKGITGWIALALLTGILMVAKPAFVLLPWLSLAVYLIASYWPMGAKPVLPSFKKATLRLLAFVLVVGAVLMPWLAFTGSVTGQPMLVVNRAPEYNFYIGNYLPSDGWKTWPTQAHIPGSMQVAREVVAAQFKQEPLAMTALFLRKLARLATGGWNEFQYSFGPFAVLSQNIWQGILLFLGLAGLLVLLKIDSAVDRNKFAIALAFAVIVAFHFVYALFEPVPRYFITAMPLVFVFAARALVYSAGIFSSREFSTSSSGSRTALLALFIFVVLGFSTLYSFNSGAQVLLPLVDGQTVRLILAFVWAVYFSCLFLLLGQLLRLSEAKRATTAWLPNMVLTATACCTVLSTAAFFIFDPAVLEWSQPLGEEAGVTLHIDDARSFDHSFVLVDCESEQLPPPLTVTVNGAEFAPEALSWFELRRADADIPVILNLQARAMGRDQRRFRQWWAYPVPSRILKPGSNTISVKVKSSRTGEKIKLYGDYLPREKTQRLPSFEQFSWTKGFVTYDHRDIRPYEKISGLPADGSSRRQRIYLACRASNAVSSSSSSSANAGAAKAQALILLDKPAEAVVSGQDPRTFIIAGAPSTEKLHGGAQLQFYLEARKDNDKIPLEINLTLSGIKAGKPFSWQSAYQPVCSPVAKTFTPVSYSVLLPPDAGDWFEVKASLLISPFPADRLYLHRKQALADSAVIRKLTVKILPEVILTAVPAEQEQANAKENVWRYF